MKVISYRQNFKDRNRCILMKNKASEESGIAKEKKMVIGEDQSDDMDQRVDKDKDHIEADLKKESGKPRSHFGSEDPTWKGNLPRSHFGSEAEKVDDEMAMGQEEEFNSAYQPEVDKWIRSTLEKEELFELPKCTQDVQPRMPTPTVRTPANTNAFADDVAKTIIVKDPNNQAPKIREQGEIPSGNEEF